MAITVKNIAAKFAAGAAEAKSFGGKFDGNTKLWALDEAKVARHAQGYIDRGLTVADYLQARGLKVVDAAAPVASVRHDGACPAIWGGACECR
jgi:hypothetical protein